MRIDNRWFQLSAAAIAMVMIANLQYSWTLFVEPLRQSTGWKLSDIQWAFTLFIVFPTLLQPLQGWLIDRMGPRLFFSIAGVLCGIGWSTLGYVSTLPMFYALYVLAGIGAGLVAGGAIGMMLKWFTTRRGLACGIVSAGFGGGTALFIPLIAYLIRELGYRSAFLSTGVFQALVLLIVAQFLRHPPVEPAPVQTTSTLAGRKSLGRHHFTTGEMLRTPQFYVLYLAFAAMATGGLLVTANVGPMAHAWGIGPGVLALATSLTALANGASRILWGWVSDRTGRELTASIAFALQAASLLLVLTVGRWSGTLFVITLILTFLTWGEVFSLFPSILGDYFGTRHATANYGVLYSAKGVAAIIGGGLAALLYEQFGSWSACFYVSAALALLAAVLAFSLRSVAARQGTKALYPAGTPLPRGISITQGLAARGR
jgi:OFA family oxalate/formate antiporter-like MFS transporter